VHRVRLRALAVGDDEGAGPRTEKNPPSDYLRLFDDRQLIDELGRRLASTAELVDQILREEHSSPGLSEDSDRTGDAIAAHDEDGSIAGEQGHDENP
jgi:hypothetical protein